MAEAEYSPHIHRLTVVVPRSIELQSNLTIYVHTRSAILCFVAGAARLGSEDRILAAVMDLEVVEDRVGAAVHEHLAIELELRPFQSILHCSRDIEARRQLRLERFVEHPLPRFVTSQWLAVLPAHAGAVSRQTSIKTTGEVAAVRWSYQR